MKRSLLLLAAVAAAVIALDRWTKRWASTTLPFGQPVQVVGDYLRLTYTRNSGVAFGIGQGTRFPYYLFSLVAIAVILWMFLRGRGAPAGGGRAFTRRLALALILGGAVGNLVDRVTRGEVVDFIEVGVARWHWPVFNVADSAVTVGVLLFALVWSRRHEHPAPLSAAAAGPALPEPSAGTEMADGDEPARPQGPGLGGGGAPRSLRGGGAGEPLP